MRDQRKFKDRYPEYRKKSKLNGRYSSQTAGAVPAFSIMNKKSHPSVLAKLEQFKALIQSAVVDRTKKKELER